MFRAPSPPPYAFRYSSDDPDAVTSWVAGRDGEHSRVIHGTGPYHYEAAILAGPAIRPGWFRSGLPQTVRARFPWSCIHVPINRSLRYAFGRRRICVDPGQLGFIPAGAEITGQHEPGVAFAMPVDDAALTAEIQARFPDNVTARPLVPLRLELPARQQVRFDDAVADLVRALDPDAASNALAHCAPRVIAALADALAISSGIIRPARLAKRRLADVEAWIDAHLGEPITIGRLCSVAQAGERSLQLSFQAHRGMSPMRFVCERRLAAAHRRIVNAGAADEITAIATGLGFTHLGRFAMAYREVYGESPSRTLQRGRTKAARAARGLS